MLLKLASFGVEVFRLVSMTVPPWLKKGAQQVVEAVESSNQRGAKLPSWFYY